jgi:hypothetical protein
VRRRGPRRAGNVRNGTITITQQKTKTALVIPVTALAEAINATPSEAMVFLLNEHGKAFTAKGFGKCCRPVPARRADRAVTARAAQGRLPPPRRGRVLGERDRQHQRHASLREVERYTRAADQARMARNAIARTTATVRKG